MGGIAIVITSGKGGVGKTTTTANVGIALSMRNKKVAVVDADIGLRNLDVVLGLENRVVYNLVDVVEGTCNVKQALIRHKRAENLYLLPAAQARTKDAVTSDQMSAVVADLKKIFDFVLIDSPAGIEAGFRNAAAGADIALVVTTPEVSAVRDADRIIGLLDSMGKKEHSLIINRIRPEMVAEGNMLDVRDVIDILSIKLIGIVPEDPEIIISTNKGEPIVMDNNSLAGKAFTNIARRILGENVPWLKLEERRKKGLFGWLKDMWGR